MRGGDVVRGPTNAAPQGGARAQTAEQLRLWSGEGGRPRQIEENPAVTARVCLAGRGERCFSLSHQIGVNGLRACEC